MLFSIIIPVYNIENYIEKCLDSILNQKMDNYEIILVDDGSTDSSGYICDKKSAEFGEKIKVIHKNNSGQSDARNIGIKASSGDYIIFVDGDDYIRSNTLEILTEIVKTGPDVIISNGYYRCINGKKITQNILFNKNKKDNCTGADVLTESSKKYPNWSPWGKVFSRQFWLNTNIWFPSGRRWEDFAVIDQIILKAKSVKIVDAFYYYVIRKGSTINSIKITHVKDALEGVKEWQIFWNNNDYPEELTSDLKNLQAKIYANTVMGYLALVKDDLDINYNDLVEECRLYSCVLKDYKGAEGMALRVMVKMLGYYNTCKCLGIYKKLRYRK